MYKILDFKSNIMCKNRRFKKIILHFIKKKVYKLILPLHKILGTYINKPPTKNTKKPHPPTKSLNTTSHNNIGMDFKKIISEAVGQSLAQLAIGGAVTILITAAVISGLLASNVITDATVLVIVGLIVLIVSVVVIMQILGRM